MKKVGLFGGTFNPIHFGHLNLAFELMEKGGLDEVWWIPTPLSPLRLHDIPVSSRHRFEMCCLALEGISQFKVLDLEINRDPPTYTIDTVKQLQEKHRDIQFFLLLGQDAVSQFMLWKQPLDLIRKISLLIGERIGRESVLPEFPEEIKTAIEKGMIKTILLDISATRIRERLKKKLYVGHLMPAKVLDFIYVNQLYFTV